MFNLKKVFESRKTCSNGAHQLVDRLFLLCRPAGYAFIGQEQSLQLPTVAALMAYTFVLFQTGDTKGHSVSH